jgi:hypothetical protein
MSLFDDHQTLATSSLKRKRQVATDYLDEQDWDDWDDSDLEELQSVISPSLPDCPCAILIIQMCSTICLFRRRKILKESTTEN